MKKRRNSIFVAPQCHSATLHRYRGRSEAKETLSLYTLPSSLEANAGALVNFEVLDFLRAKGASKDPTRVIAKVVQSEYKFLMMTILFKVLSVDNLYLHQVYDYLVNTAASVQTRENVNEFLTGVKQHDLAKAEVLNIINIRPAADVEIFPVSIKIMIFSYMLLLSAELEIIENCEERFPDEEVIEIVELVKKTLPPPVNKTPEEITKGDKDTSTVKEGKVNEISQDQNEGAEQMDTS
ncbi:DNA-directed RNA polymerase III subunit RPC9, partial [Mucuna pruriens]